MTTEHTTMTPPPTRRRLRRSATDRRFTGVSGGIGEHLDIDPTVVRIGFVALAFANGVGLVAYLAAWILMPRPEDPALAAPTPTPPAPTPAPADTEEPHEVPEPGADLDDPEQAAAVLAEEPTDAETDSTRNGDDEVAS